MRITPMPLAGDQGTFRGPLPIKIADLRGVFPGYSPLEDVSLSAPPLALPGHTTLVELALVTSIVRFSQAEHFAQVGTFDGMTVRMLLDNCPELKSIVTVDLPVEAHAAASSGARFHSGGAAMSNAVDVGHRFRNHPRAGIVRDLRKDSARLAPGDFENPPDVFFVDGDHSYDYCVSDTRIAHRVLARPGIIFWHDYGKVAELPGVIRALTELADDRAYALYWVESTSLVVGVQR